MNSNNNNNSGSLYSVHNIVIAMPMSRALDHYHAIMMLRLDRPHSGDQSATADENKEDKDVVLARVEQGRHHRNAEDAWVGIILPVRHNANKSRVREQRPTIIHHLSIASPDLRCHLRQSLSTCFDAALSSCACADSANESRRSHRHRTATAATDSHSRFRSYA